MLHTIIVHDPVIFKLIKEQTEAKKVPLLNLPYEVFSQGNIRIIGGYSAPVSEVLTSVNGEFNPDTVFFLSESYPVSDEKLPGDIVLPNVFFPYDTEIETTEDINSLLGKSETVQNGNSSSVNSHLSNPVFLEHYPVQGDYNFESFGLSVGGIHVSGIWNEKIEDFRIRLRVVYENDTFDSNLFHFLETAQKLSIIEKVYPVAYIATEDKVIDAKNLWSIIGFIIGSIDPDLIAADEETETGDDEEEWVDGNEKS
ncbi:hypothetical protein GW819_03185 [Candidatus Gracilibacteria bacterium]|nr:hypothetical protein [Candidatus Gracilibacteria bacterium]OIO76167.1 MAG: hypothetical protein AUJ87_03460 [Candidatus Gracilibacteria bacterium CG1_02_38_174]PIQ11728.1 MAG: hypothetical protein COW68_02015 [Candidatus Gracilibacteria bacterium CG18_big_fil_WC_8_21_14_2_50_38_16]PIQ41001.1 MAG: hypothetical protein COW06_04330 [Candidatus Gracilibacteria bacterium CG12_big_fil_rev_8_21_14_0_65_38_15]PIZ01952.1 MAG: hypothetical protein COY60_00850 [Candidatus Gracilibacteria bacterium CG_4